MEGQFELVLVNPHQIKAIPGRKTDASVASDTWGVSGRRIIEAIISGQDDPDRLAELAKRKLRAKIPELRLALADRVRDHHRFMLQEYLNEWKAIGESIDRIEQEIGQRVAPFETAVALWGTIPGVNRVTACNLVAEIGVNMDQLSPLGNR